LRQRLRARGHGEEEIEAALEHLARQGLQSDVRWADALTRRRQAQGYGPLRIRAEIRARAGETSSGARADDLPGDDAVLGDSTSASAAARAGAGVANEEAMDRAVAMLERRFAGMDLSTTRPRGRALRLLVNRGFPPDMALRAVERVSRRHPARDGQDTAAADGVG